MLGNIELALSGKTLLSFNFAARRCRLVCTSGRPLEGTLIPGGSWTFALCTVKKGKGVQQNGFPRHLTIVVGGKGFGGDILAARQWCSLFGAGAGADCEAPLC